MTLKPHANRRNIVGCYLLRPFGHPVACCWMLLRVVAQSLKPVKLFSQQLPTFLLFRDRRSVAQQCWICLYRSSNTVVVVHAHCEWFTKTYGLYPSHDALQVPTLLRVVASVCTPLPTWVGTCCVCLLTALPITLKLKYFANNLPFAVFTVLDSWQMQPDNFEIRCGVEQSDDKNTTERTGG